MAQHFINGQWVAASNGETLPVIDPSTGEVFDQLARGTAADIDKAVAAARAALDGPWGRMTATERGRILQKMGVLILAQAEELARLESRDTGKPITQARNDIVVAARYCEFYGASADKVHGQEIPYLNDFQVIVVREPYGVTAHILPWNYPAQMFGRSVVPALAMGNAAVLKPSEDACMTPLAFCRIAKEAGMPDGALNVVTGLGEEAGAALTAHGDIDFVTFTGSPEVGVLVQKAAANRTLKCVLELGGKSPQIVFEDADLDRAATSILKAITQNGGQTCSAGSRLLVQRSIYDSFVAKVAALFAQSAAGTPEQDRECGPLINAAQKERVEGFISRAKASGIPVLAQGKVCDGVHPGASTWRPRCSARCRATINWPATKSSARYFLRCLSTTRQTPSHSRMPPTSACWPASGRVTAVARPGCQAHEMRPGLHQHLRCRRRRRAALWRRQAQRARARERLHGTRRVLHREDGRPVLRSMNETHPMKLQGKVAIVTGAASGFGAEIARHYIAEGCQVAVADINEAGARKSPDRSVRTPSP